MTTATASATSRLIYLTHDLDAYGSVPAGGFDSFTERHPVTLSEPELRRVNAALDERALASLAADPGVEGVIFEVRRGVPTRGQLRLARRLVGAGRETFLYWPAESAVERLDEERIASFWRLLLAHRAWRAVRGFRPAAAATLETMPAAVHSPRPVDAFRSGPLAAARGLYLRFDYWATLTSGGSYGHTCYVAKELDALSRGLICIMGSRFPMLDDLGLHQCVLPFSPSSSVEQLLAANDFYVNRLLPLVELLAPGFIYERIVIGNCAGATIAARLDIPYIVEFNGSEVSMARAYGKPLERADELEARERQAFDQATLISVVSQRVAEDLIARGVDPRRILVSPNAVDCEAYRRPAPSARRELRRSLGFDQQHLVIAFSGTFGGWHGVESLAAAIPAVCAAVPQARFLLIGDGQFRSAIDEVVKSNQLESQVKITGSVPQVECARLLGAGDIFVSPHGGNIGDVPFFGSPTKLFEYMALGGARDDAVGDLGGGAIIASDLEQIGEVLQPAMSLAQLEQGEEAPEGARAILTPPGDAKAFTRALIALANRPALAAVLGGNARAAALSEHSWQRRVERLRDVLEGRTSSEVARTRSLLAVHELKVVETGDRFKDEVQNQWNNNPCGSQYGKAPARTLEWFLDIEKHRYGEYGPWMPKVMEFDRHRGAKVLEIGGGLGTDLSQFARNGALVTDFDLAAGHLELARENFKLRNLPCEFLHGDAENLPFPDNTFDVVYSNGVIHHTPNTERVIGQIHRVLKPGGKAIIMVYAENSWHYWASIVGRYGLRNGMLERNSVGDMMSQLVEMTANDARPLVKVYTAKRLRAMFRAFHDISIVKRQLTPGEVPLLLKPVPIAALERLWGWNLIIKGVK